MTSPRASRALLHAQVFVGGAAVMALELAGSRLLAPVFGSTLFVWGSLIGVVMTALAVGAWIGGRRADASPRHEALSFLLLLAGLAAALMPAISRFVLDFASPLGLTWGPLVATTLLLGPATVLLGTAVPFAVRLAGEGVATSGSTAGRVYALSTAGSIAGTFATTFLLVPNLRIPVLLSLVGALVVVVGVLGMKPRAPAAIASGLILLLLTPPALTAFERGASLFDSDVVNKVLFETDSAYHSIKVVEDRNPLGDENLRTLVMDGLRHASTYTVRVNETSLAYVPYFHLASAFTNVSSALFIGGGGFSGPKQFLAAYPNATVDVVEIDPAVVDVARDWFFAPVDDPRVRVFVEDGRRFLAHADREYDVIVLDAYSRTYVPFHLMTVEFFEEVRERLAPGGVVVSNVIAATSGAASYILKAEVRTMERAFPDVHAFPVRGETWPTAQNVMLVATTEGGTRSREEVLALARAVDVPGRDVLGMAEKLFDGLDVGNALILRDDFAPVETLLNPVTRQPFDPEGN